MAGNEMVWDSFLSDCGTCMRPCTLKVLRLLASTLVQSSWWPRPWEHASTAVHFSLSIALATPSQCVYAEYSIY